MSKHGVGVSLLLIVLFHILVACCFIVVFSWFTNGCGAHPMSDFFSVCFIKHGGILCWVAKLYVLFVCLLLIGSQ